jgi:hypothetical protein
MPSLKWSYNCFRGGHPHGGQLRSTPLDTPRRMPLLTTRKVPKDKILTFPKPVKGDAALLRLSTRVHLDHHIQFRGFTFCCRLEEGHLEGNNRVR